MEHTTYHIISFSFHKEMAYKILSGMPCQPLRDKSSRNHQYHEMVSFFLSPFLVFANYFLSVVIFQGSLCLPITQTNIVPSVIIVGYRLYGSYIL